MKKILLLLIIAFLSLEIFAQTGPGGVGTTSGSGNLKLWLRGDSTSIATGVDTLFDLSGYNNHFVQTDVIYQPSITTINGFNALDFDGSGDFLLNKDGNNYLDGQTAFTLLFVIKSDVTATDKGFFIADYPEGSDDSLALRYDATGTNGGQANILTASTGANGVVESSAGIQSTNNQLITFSWVSNTAPKLHINGAENTLSYSNLVLGTISCSDTVVLGKGGQDVNVTDGWDGLIAEVIYFNRQLNSAERTIVENYIAARYNLTISNDEYSSTTYIYDVAGIGIESDGDHSGSVSAGFGLYEDNSTLNVNGEYIFVAHDNTDNDIASIRTGIEITTNLGASGAAWNRDWYLEKSTGADVDARIFFDFGDGIEGGGVPQNISNYRLIYRAGTSGNYTVVTTTSSGIQSGDQVYFEVENDHLLNGYYTLGTVDQTNSPVEGSSTQTWYTLVGGNWTDSDIWTLDPSGALPNNPLAEIPDANDNVVILSGRTVQITEDGKLTQKLTVTGRLELGTTSGHDFTEIRGSGRIVLEDDNFPAGDATHFITAGQGEGTVIYTGAANIDITTSRTFYNMEILMDDPSYTVTLEDDYTINGNLKVESGELQINDNTNTTPLIITVGGDVTVLTDAAISVGSANAYVNNVGGTYGDYHEGFHQLIVGGDFLNRGSVRLTNQLVPNYNTNPATVGGAVSLVFTGASNNTFTCENTTDLYNLVIDKGTSYAYQLNIYAEDKSHFALFGDNNNTWNRGAGADQNANPETQKALWIKAGTLRLTGQVYIPTLNEGGTDFALGKNARVLLDGPNVFLGITANETTTYTGLSHGAPSGVNNGGGSQGLYVLGKLQINTGSFLLGEAEAINFRNEAPGAIEVNGGTLEANQIAISSGAIGTYSFNMTGGIVRLTGDYNADANNALLHLDNSDMVFSMSGGEIIIEGVAPTDPATETNGILISSAEGNYNVTGGTIRIDYSTADVEINSTANFYNFEVDTNTTVLLENALEISNDLTIRNGAELDADGKDLQIGGDFVFNDGAIFTHGNNTTRFIGSQNSDIDIDNSSDNPALTFYNLVLDKNQRGNPTLYWDLGIDNCPGRSTTPGNANNTIIQIANNLIIERGQFTIQRYTVSLLDSLSITNGKLVYNPLLPGRLELNGSAQQFITGSAIYNPQFGNIELDNTSGAKTTTNIRMDYLTLTTGVMDIDENRLTIDTNLVDGTGFGATKMIKLSGGHGAKGLELKVDGAYTATDNIVFPIGTENGATDYYSRFVIDVDANTNLTGYVRAVAVNREHPASQSGDNYQYYWTIELSDDFTTTDNNCDYYFYSDKTYSKTGFFNSLIYGPLENTQGVWNGGIGGVIINSTTPVIFGVNFSVGDFTAGTWGDMFLSNTTYSNGTGGGNWTLAGSWTNGVPGNNDVAIIRSGDIITMNANTRVCSDLTIRSGGTLNLASTTGHTLTKVSGGGKIRISSNNIPVGDFENFLYNDTAVFEYYGGSYNIPANFEVYPNLLITGTGAKTLPNQDILVRKNLTLDGDTLTLNGGDDLYVNDSIIIDNAGILQFPTSTDPVGVTVFKSIDLSGNSAANSIQIITGGANTGNHSLTVWDDIVLNSSSLIDLYDAANNVVDLYFEGDGNSEINDAGGATIDLNRLIINKAVNTADVDFLEAFSLNGATNGISSQKALYLISGDLIINNSGTNINLTTGGGDFRIPSEASLRVSNATVNASGSNTGIYLDGLMRVGFGSNWLLNGGTNNYIEYSSSGNAQIDIYQGTLRVGSQIRRSVNTEEGVLKFHQMHANSTVIIGEDDAPEGSRGVFEILNAGSEFSQVADANITIVRQQTSPSIAAVYLDPDVPGLESGSSITFGNASTPAGQTIGLNSVTTLKNIVVGTTNNPTVQLQINPLNIDENITIGSNSTLDANGLAINTKGDFLNYGDFEANGNTVTLNSSSNQRILGKTTFYNLTKSTLNVLGINDAITDTVYIDNDFRIELGTFCDSSNAIIVKGDLLIDGTHEYGGTGNGIEMMGSDIQNIYGNGTLGMFTISNASGTLVETGNELTITDGLNLNGGLLDVGANLLNLGVDARIIEGKQFDNTNMIRTNSSFTDNGVRKTFPSTASMGGAYNYTIPIGSGSKYTPVEYKITTNGNNSGTIITKAADEPHPSILEDSETPEIVDVDNVLQYHWVLKSDAVTGFSADVEMEYDPADVYFTSPYDITDYITARLLNDGSGQWNKYTTDDFDEANNLLHFNFNNVNADGIEGDYTAGIDDAIPDQVPFYETNQSGSWTDGNIWTPNIPGGPRGAMVRINTGHTVTMPSNFQSSYTTTINGTLKVDSTFGHRLGEVDGTGTLYTKRPSLPAGYYADFFSSSGGTLEYGGSASYDVLSTFSEVNNLKFSGTGERRFPNQNVTILGDFIIEGDDATLEANNENDKKITIGGDIDFITGSFDSGLGVNAIIEMNGSIAQSISGDFTGTNDFNHFVINNSNGVTFNNSADIYGNITFTSGIINVADNEILTMTVYNNTISGAGSSAYIDGILSKKIEAGGSFTFPVGDGGRYAPTVLTNTQPSANLWEVEYFDANPITDPMNLDPSQMGTGLQLVSEYEYWRVEGPASGISPLLIRWDAYSILPAMTSNRTTNIKMVEWITDKWEIVTPATVTDGGVNSGTILSSNSLTLNSNHYFTIGTTEGTPLPAAGFLTLDTTICEGSTITLRAMVTGNPSYSIDVDDGTSTTAYTGAASPITFNVSPAVTTTYTITEVTEDTDGSSGGPVSSTVTIFGDSVTVTVLPVPDNSFTLTPGATASYCAGGTGVAIGLSDSEIGVSYQLLLDGVAAGSPVAGDGDDITFGNQTEAGSYTVEATDDSDVSGTCTVTMTGSVVLSINPLPMAVNQTDSICSGVAGETAEVTVNLTAFENGINNEGGVSYTWYEESGSGLIPDPTDAAYLISTTFSGGISVVEDFYCVVENTTTGCLNTATVLITILRVPETGPQYHISNDWSN